MATNAASHSGSPLSRLAMGNRKKQKRATLVLALDSPLSQRRSVTRRRVSMDKSCYPESDAAYTQVRSSLVVELQDILDAVGGIYSPEVKQFVLAQDDIRRNAGCSSKSASATYRTDFAKLIDARNSAADVAVRALSTESQSNAGEMGQVNLRKLSDVAKNIRDKFGLQTLPTNPILRAQYFPYTTWRNDESCIESALDIFIGMDTVIKLCDRRILARKKAATPLNGVLIELARIIQERAQEWSQGEDKVLQNVCSVLARWHTVKAQWDAETFRGELGVRRKALSQAAIAFAEAELEAEVAENAMRLSAKKKAPVKALKSALAKRVATSEEKAQTLLDEQLACFSYESEGWAIQKYVAPEIWHALQPATAQGLTAYVATVWSECSKEWSFTDRRLGAYDDVVQASPSMLLAQLRGKKCILRRYDISQASQIMALCSELAMQDKLKSYAAAQISAIFSDNSYVYVHYSDANNTLEQAIKEEIFNDSIYNPVLLMRGMLHCVHYCHREGIVIGDIALDSWVLCHGAPRLCAFGHVRLLRTPQSSSSSGIGRPLADISPREFESPEIQNARAEGKHLLWTRQCDVYALAKTLSVIAEVTHTIMKTCGADTVFEAIVMRMCVSDPNARANIDGSLAKSDELLGTLPAEMEFIRKQTNEIKDSVKAIARARQEVAYARDEVAKDLHEVSCLKQKVKEKELLVAEKDRKLKVSVCEAEERAELEKTLRPPAYWTTSVERDSPTSIHLIPKTSSLFTAFSKIILPEDPSDLNCGWHADEEYSSLRLVGAWRCENPSLWRNYAVERGNVLSTIQSLELQCTKFGLRTGMQEALAELPDSTSLSQDCNEVYLLHATGPDALLSITTSGVNERFSSAALFGKGSYFAEDIAKSDQYVCGDPVLDGHPELHRRFFPHDGEFSFPEYPKKAHYVVLCRVIVGVPVRVQCQDAGTKMMTNLTFPDTPIFATNDERELAVIPGTSPPVHFHSLVAEKGGDIQRFREICQFHSERVYPEYIICYERE